MGYKKIIKTLPEFLNENTEVNNMNNHFWDWFGNSKLKENDKPTIFYHGTKTNFNSFKPSKSVGNQGETDQIEGIYFTTNKDAASFFALGDDDRFIKSVYLSIQNPYHAKDMNELKHALDTNLLADVNKKLVDKGYDGLIIDKGFYANGGPFTLYLPFYPNQIKSIDNDGSWDVGDNNIYS